MELLSAMFINAKALAQVNIDSKEVQEVITILKKVLKQTGYAAVIMQFFSYTQCYESFSKSGFDMMSHPYTIPFN